MKRSQVQVLVAPRNNFSDDVKLFLVTRGLSSIGRAPALQAGGQEFDSPRLHNKKHPPEMGGVLFGAATVSP
jgi:hypothetical protein